MKDQEKADLELRMSQARTQLILNQPFFATLLMGLEHHEDVAKEKTETMATDGVGLWYNPEFVQTLTMDELKGVYCHEVMHPACMHHTRRGNRDAVKWNKACDYAINPMILEAGFTLPQGALVNPAFDNMSAEQIYNMLPDGDGQGDDQKQPQSGYGGESTGQKTDPTGCGEVLDGPAQSESEKTKLEDDMRKKVDQATTVAKAQGSLPAFMDRILKAMKPKVDWKTELTRFLIDIMKNDYSFSKPNKRFLHTGFILPTLYNVEMGAIYLFVDTSMSIDEEMLNQFGGEMQDIMATYNKGFTVLYVDTEVAGEQTFEPDDEVILDGKGGGGTNFIPPFRKLRNEGITPHAAIYFTDMECDSFPDEPDYPVLWADYGTGERVPPFGEVLRIRD